MLRTFNKPVLTVTQQVEKLKESGLLFQDENKARLVYLNNINFYRLQGYIHYFQTPSTPHSFVNSMYFENIMEVYFFDSKLRALLFNAVEKIEIALRNQIVYGYALAHGCHWHLNPSLFRDYSTHQDFLYRLNDTISKSDEKFIDKYKEDYDSPKEPACWMMIELISFRDLSGIFKNLYRKDNCKKDITSYFGLSSPDVLENWLKCINFIRNRCAHHGRLWYRNLPYNIEIPRNPSYQFASTAEIDNIKLYAYICCISYLLNISDPDNSFKKDLIQLFDEYDFVKSEDLGFPINWKNDEFWKIDGSSST